METTQSNSLSHLFARLCAVIAVSCGFFGFASVTNPAVASAIELKNVNPLLKNHPEQAGRLLTALLKGEDVAKGKVAGLDGLTLSQDDVKKFTAQFFISIFHPTLVSDPEIYPLLQRAMIEPRAFLGSDHLIQKLAEKQIKSGQPLSARQLDALQMLADHALLLPILEHADTDVLINHEYMQRTLAENIEIVNYELRNDQSIAEDVALDFFTQLAAVSPRALEMIEPSLERSRTTNLISKARSIESADRSTRSRIGLKTSIASFATTAAVVGGAYLEMKHLGPHWLDSANQALATNKIAIHLHENSVFSGFTFLTFNLSSTASKYVKKLLALRKGAWTLPSAPTDLAGDGNVLDAAFERGRTCREALESANN